MKSIALRYDLLKIIVVILLVICLFSIIFPPESSAGEKSINAKELAKVSHEPAAAEIESNLKLPEFPSTLVILEYEPKTNTLVDSYEQERFLRNETGDEWIPIIPEEISYELGENYSIKLDESNVWHAWNDSGMQFVLDMETLNWNREMESELITEESSEHEIRICEKANPARIMGPGEKVKVINSLIPLRSSPDASSDNILRALPIGTNLNIIAAPVCTDYLGGANLWWRVQTEDGQIGWAAEASALGPAYYFETIK